MLKFFNKTYQTPVILNGLNTFKDNIDGSFSLVNIDLDYRKV